jgi:hypothetical protein
MSDDQASKLLIGSLSYCQTDLNPNDVMILDAWDVIFVWIGREANKDEITEAYKIAIEYLTTDPSHRGLDLPIFKVKQGLEPANFTAFFGIWDHDLFKATKSYTDLKAEVHAKNNYIFYEEISKNSSKYAKIEMKPSDYPKYAYEELCKPIEHLPENVIAEHREVGH